ncbi:ABC transporter ATP-binding protein [Nocardioides sp.]|uniref:ABC transporter ATP-binding protein n=1 Tax=Nocardioides sp. TaxID=35761 RepID=UPI00351117BA
MTPPPAPITAPATGPAPAALAGEGLTLAYDTTVIARDLDVAIPAGAVTCIVGANACGKSTLLRALGRLLAPRAGRVVLDGRDLRAYSTRDVAHRLGLLPQTPLAPDGITVADLVARGRYPHQRWFRPWSAEDECAVQRALELTRTGDLADRSVDELSGGQRQRVWIAMTLAQGTELMLLDEPTTYLDLAHQVEVLDLLLDLNRAEGRTIAMVLHDLNQAARYSDHLIAMRAGRVVAAGPPRDILTEDLVAEVFGLDCRVVLDEVAGTPLVLPIGRHHTGVGVR